MFILQLEQSFPLYYCANQKGGLLKAHASLTLLGACCYTTWSSTCCCSTPLCAPGLVPATAVHPSPGLVPTAVVHPSLYLV